jgi:hypothetical protein
MCLETQDDGAGPQVAHIQYPQVALRIGTNFFYHGGYRCFRPNETTMVGPTPERKARIPWCGLEAIAA